MYQNPNQEFMVTRLHRVISFSRMKAFDDLSEKAQKEFTKLADQLDDLLDKYDDPKRPVFRDDIENHLIDAMNRTNELTPSRELSLVKTKIEEAQLWLTKAKV